MAPDPHVTEPIAISLPLEGMSCVSCARRIEQALLETEGVTAAGVNPVTKTGEVMASPNTSLASLLEAVKGAGYGVSTATTQLSLEGMSCASCAARIEKALSAVTGVTAAAVNLTTGKARVEHLAGAFPASRLVEAVEGAGYRAHLPSAEGGPSAEEAGSPERGLKRQVLIAAVLTAPIFLMEMGGHLVPALHHWISATLGRGQSWLLQFLLATLVLFGPGRVFFQTGFPALLRKAPNMNSLVALGSGAAYLYSLVATFAPSWLPPGTAEVYYEPAALIVTLILVGRYFEERAKGRTGEAITRLLNLSPKTARKVGLSGIEEVPLTEVEVGDVLQVRPGDTVPVDGEVLEGDSYLDESMITGEPVPVAKSPGAPVIGGTVNTTGAFTLRTTKVGADTVLARIVRMVEEAQGSKLPIQALVDKVTLWFVPAVLLLAALTTVAWLLWGPQPRLTYALVAAVSVLIIACPCAMGLATPTSILVGTGRAAEMGLLFRGGDGLQTLGEASVLAFDKTGTLTEGRPKLTDLILREATREEALTLIASVESHSEHPIASALVEAAREENLSFSPATAFRAHAGLGVSGRVDDREVKVGADRYLLAEGLDLAPLQGEAEQLAADGKTPLYLAVDGKVAALVAVADPIKKGTPIALQALRELGLKLAMITGDNAATAQAVARSLGIDEVVAEVMPEGKVEAVTSLRSRFGTLAFVGDGINDAPALATADVGLAVGNGTDVAIESADVVVMSGDLRGVASALALSRSTLRNIKQNLFWAFAYNVVLIPVAAGVLYPFWGILLSPVLAAGAMAFSSVFVLLNALRLKKVRLSYAA